MNDTSLTRIDGVPVSGGTFEILPGRHKIEVIGKKRRDAIGAGAMLVSYATRTNKRMFACFVARGGHSYIVRTWGSVSADDLWQVEVFDQETTTTELTDCHER